MTSEKHKLAKFWDKNAESYSKSSIRNEEAYLQKIQKTQTHFKPDMSLMEFGCGTGTTALHHAPHVKQILATDVSPNMLEIAQAKAKDLGIDNVTFQQATLDDLAATGQTFDGILGMNIIHLLADKEKALTQVQGMLKSGGVFISSTACLADSWLMILWPLLILGRLVGKVPLLRIFSKKHLERAIENAGFTIQHSEKLNGTFIVATRK